MIIRKPYAFLIKNFKKIHIVLLLLSLFLAYSIFDVSSYVNEFMRIGIYDSYANPVTRHITIFMLIATFIMIIGSSALLLLLRHKGKPWKIYLVPVVTYVFLYFILSMIKSFFNSYTISVEVTDLRLSRDLIMIFIVLQLPAIAIFVMRTFGLDINKFNFNADTEFLELSEEDREEIEVSFDVDINTFKRLYKRIIRNISYFYKEYNLVSNIVIIFLVGILFFNIFQFVFIKSKTYNEGNRYNYDNYTIKVLDSYITNKDGGGNVISPNSNFVVVKFSITNNSSEARNFNTSKFHLKAGNKDYTTTETTFMNEFSDIGMTYKKTTKIKSNQSLDFIIIYKVDKKIRKGRFVLFYQENRKEIQLRKFNLKIKDLSKIDESKAYKLGDFIDINYLGEVESIAIDEYSYSDSIDYNYNKCNAKGCNVLSNHYDIDSDYKILSLEFASDTWEAKNMIDFLGLYGKIEYKDSSGDFHSEDVEFAVNKSYLGKVVYLKVPNYLEEIKDVKLHLIVRNMEYYYSL